MKVYNKQNYISPEVQLVYIEVEQAILNGSVENIGGRKEDIDW